MSRAIADRGAHAVIPHRRNATLCKTVTAGAIAPDESLRASKCLGRIRRADAAPPGPRSLLIVATMERISPRSRVETKMHGLKLLGQRLMAWDFDRQVAELQIRIAVMNADTALCIALTEAVG